ncbi:MAG: hypothetical protein OER90_01900 [Gemmatimonadota bacterium]|nr:hypothetical protein [Gemmatimonadota bacterium]
MSAVREAVALRAWAQAVLGGQEDPVCPEVSAVAWSLFLEGERCALPLHRSLEGSSSLSVVAEEHIGRLRMGAAAEALGAVLREVVTLDRGELPSRAFAKDAAATYTVRCVLRRWKLPAVLMKWSYSSSFAILLSSFARRSVWRQLLVL